MNIQNEEILSKIKEWTNPPYDVNTIEEIKELVDSDNDKELMERFAVDLEFGTGGMRGIMRSGSNGMNPYVVAKASQGLANYIKNTKIDSPKAVIAYDSRNNSKEFASISAIVLASNGIKTYLFEDIRPTPELSFAVRHFAATAGIVITASHNPKQYNGYKVYWNDGAQVVAPHDEGIIAEVKKVKTLDMVKQDDFDKLKKGGMIEIIGEKIDNLFIDTILKLNINSDIIKKSSVKIVYTPLHGTGKSLIPQSLEKLGFKDVSYVEEQMVADGNFPTVKKPNPEEAEALKMGIELAKKIGADIVIATDPDADRMGIVVKSGNDYEIITGNQIGSIIEYYILSEKKKRGELPKNAAIVKTIVTTPLQDNIAEAFDVKVFNVLTGFKYIGQKIREFEADNNNYQYLFGGEESYGYLNGTHSRDKDAISATLIIAEIASYLKYNNKSVYDYLEEIYSKYGYYFEKTISKDVEGLDGVRTVKLIMEYFRVASLNKIGGIGIANKIDYKADDVYDSEDSKYLLPKADVIKYILVDGSTVTLRPSGTEPKIKFYYATKGSSMEEAKDKLDKIMKYFEPKVDDISKKLLDMLKMFE